MSKVTRNTPFAVLSLLVLTAHVNAAAFKQREVDHCCEKVIYFRNHFEK